MNGIKALKEKYQNANKILQYKVPDRFSKGTASRLPEAYKKFWHEWKQEVPSPVHYIPEPGKWKRDPVTGVVTPVQNVPLPLLYTNESNEGLWGGESVIKGFQKRDPLKRRVPHYWFPHLHRSVVYSEILNKHMSVTVTQRALQLIHKNYGLDHYILKTPACDLQSLLAVKLKRKMLFALLKKDFYPEDPVKKEEVLDTYSKYLENYTEDEIEWYGLSFSEAIQKQKKIDQAMNKPQLLKIVYRAQLVEKLREAGIEGVKAALDEYETEKKSSSWLSKINPFSSRK